MFSIFGMYGSSIYGYPPRFLKPVPGVFSGHYIQSGQYVSFNFNEKTNVVT